MKQKPSLIDHRFGKLVVIETAQEDKTGKPKWLCRCDCGNEKIIYEQNLRYNKTKSCGCYNKEVSKKRMSKGWSKILTKDFLIKEHIENKKSLREIGKEVGCSVTCVIKYMRKNELQTNELIYDIVGKSFNKLTVISLAHTKNGSSFWNVKCECGTEKVVNGKSLVRHSIVSCGCWNKQKEWKGCRNLSKTYWSSLVTSANKRNLSFNISIDYAWELFNKQNGKCALSGHDIILDKSLSQNYDKHIYIQTASLDRIDSSLGYCEGNVQWVHVILNKMKSNLQEADFIKWCQDVSSYRSKT